MKIQTLAPAIKPGLVLAAINTTLCLLFGLGAFLAVVVGAALVEFWNLPLPLVPFVVLGAIPVTLLVWAIFAFRLQSERGPIRWAIVALGTLPLQAVIGLAIFFAIWFVAMPQFDAVTVTAPLVALIIAGIATACCGAFVLLVGNRKADPENP